MDENILVGPPKKTSKKTSAKNLDLGSAKACSGIQGPQKAGDTSRRGQEVGGEKDPCAEGCGEKAGEAFQVKWPTK